MDRTNTASQMLVQPSAYTVVVQATVSLMKEDEKRGRVFQVKSLFHQRYSSTENSDVAVTIPAEGGSVIVLPASE